MGVGSPARFTMGSPQRPSTEGLPMETLQQATERICDLKGSIFALEAFASAIIRTLSSEQKEALRQEFEQETEAAKTVLLGSMISEYTIASFERDTQRLSSTM